MTPLEQQKREEREPMMEFNQEAKHIDEEKFIKKQRVNRKIFYREKNKDDKKIPISKRSIRLGLNQRPLNKGESIDTLLFGHHEVSPEEENENKYFEKLACFDFVGS